MKLILLVLVTVSVAKAVEFNVTSGNKTCLKLQLGGQVRFFAPGNETLLLDLDTATKNNDSTCTFIRLDLNNSVQVGFLFNASKDAFWSVTPVIEFIPKDVFPGTFNQSDTVTYQTQELDRFGRNESYECVASITREFVEQKQQEVNINVTALTHNFRIQSLDEDIFVEGVRCKEDATTTAVPTTTHASTTLAPSFTQDVICEDNSTMKLHLIGALKLDITYTTHDKKTNRSIINVPTALPHSLETSCSSNSLETVVIPFFVNWSIGFNFSRDGDKKYYVSGVVVNYVHDEHLPGSINNGTPEVVIFTSSHFLEATSGSYYYCKAQVEQQLKKNVVKLITTDLKYQAFNEKGNITFTGKVSECKADEDSSSVVPIAVGAALAGLVVIVLIAYLIGRRRSRKAGYESV